MAAGAYTSPTRVERDGRLVAYAGEVMTMAEAEARGLVDCDAVEVSEVALKDMTKTQLLETAKSRGIKVPSKATNEAILTLIDQHDNPEPVANPEPEPVANPEPEPVANPEPEPVANPEPEPVAE